MDKIEETGIKEAAEMLANSIINGLKRDFDGAGTRALASETFVNCGNSKINMTLSIVRTETK